ncbi:RING-H2 finger protein ATL67-like [Vicia villosa]|uniref:RING-H2 finger protein ATL67-like n=1 Tax=Vicia villosa TaxID=3911 RepID=UPI00273C947D|nr:RING-H2 finger protein ATL67-like [Vicia villosa]
MLPHPSKFQRDQPSKPSSNEYHKTNHQINATIEWRSSFELLLVLNAATKTLTHLSKLPKLFSTIPSPKWNIPLFILQIITISMSSSTPYTYSPPPPPPPPLPYLSNLGFGYSIAIALGFLFLLSTLILSSYLCCRTFRNRRNNHNSNINNQRNSDGIVLPRVIFVAEEDDHDRDDIVLGLDQSVINSYPRLQYGKETMGQDGTCSICLCEYKDAEMLRMMPECRHYFHLCCLDSWLKLNGSCPVCRNSPMPTPMSTPLQEVVPLSHYIGERRTRR